MGYAILIVGLVGDTAEVSTSFLGTILRLQQRLALTADMSIAFEFRHTTKEAVDYFLQSQSDRLLIVDGLMGLDVDWIVKRHPDDMHEVVAAYPLREIDWTKVSSMRERGTTDPDRLRTESYVYNFTPIAGSTDCERGSYLRVASAQAKIVSLSREGASRFLDRFCPWTKRLEDCIVDVASKGVNSGPYDFSGCIGTRLLANASKAS